MATHDLRVVVSDDSPIFATAAAGHLAGVLEAATVDVIAPVDETRILDAAPDVLIIDPLFSQGLDRLVASLEERFPGIRLIAAASQPTPELARFCTEIGFRAFLPKTMETAAFIRAVRVVCDGGNFIHKKYGQKLVTRDIGRTVGRALSGREETILRQAALGYSNRAIADELGLSPKTVDTHRARAMEKLSLSERPDLVRMAAARGWLR